MAVLCSLTIHGGRQEDAVALEQLVSQRLEATGEPPESLIFIAAHPSEGGLTITMAFRTEALARAEVEGHLRGEAESLDLRAGECSVAPIWSMAVTGPR